VSHFDTGRATIGGGRGQRTQEVLVQNAAIRAVALVLAAMVLPASEGGSASAGSGPGCAEPTLVGTSKKDRLTGTPGDDVIVGRGGDDVIDGRGGEDVICGGGGADTIVGGAGNDELRGGGSRIVRGDGDVLYYRDRLVGGAGDDVLVPGRDGGDHATGWDLLDFSDAPGPLVADVGADTIEGHGSDVVIGDDYAILGSRHADELKGGDGDDELYGGDGADKLVGGDGEDDLNDSGYSYAPADAAEDVLIGGAGADDLDAEGGNDRILGGGGSDTISDWGRSADRIEGGGGRDSISDNLVLSADQVLDAGPGRDEVLIDPGYRVGGEKVHPRTVIDLAAGTARIPAYDVAFPFVGAERLLSYLPALTWRGTDGPEMVAADPTFDPRTSRLIADGRGGADRINGTIRADRIDGGSGRDIAHGYDGADTCVAVEVRRSC
jgi:Ca2+-binding RTX toxin-like protein